MRPRQKNYERVCCESFLKRVSLFVLLLLIGNLSIAASKPKVANAEKNTLRDPFWPVGYKAKVLESKDDQQNKTLRRKDWEEAQKLVVVNGVSKISGEYIAIINTETKAVGEEVSVEYGGRKYLWKVEGVSPDGNVKLTRISVE
jgi:hypothetical protein